MRTLFAASAAVLALTTAASVQAAEIKFIGPPEGAISSGVIVPAGAETFYVAGITPSPVTPAANGVPAEYGDTKTQTIGVIKRLQDALKTQGADLKDVVMMRVYMVAAPDGKLDFAGMNAAYNKYFGTADQPNKPARTTVQVAALVTAGALLEVEVQAARNK